MNAPYTKKEIARIKHLAKKKFGNHVSVRHIYPRAYCVARPALRCFIFAIPPRDSEDQVKQFNEAVGFNSRSQIISGFRNQDDMDVDVGDWCAIAYISDSISGAQEIIEVL